MDSKILFVRWPASKRGAVPGLPYPFRGVCKSSAVADWLYPTTELSVTVSVTSQAALTWMLPTSPASLPLGPSPEVRQRASAHGCGSSCHCPLIMVSCWPPGTPRRQWRDWSFPTPLEWQAGAESGQKEHLSPHVRGLISQWDCIMQRDGLLFCQLLHPDIGETILQLLLPECLKLYQNYEQQGVDFCDVRQRCYWPRMIQDITDWCQLCERCISAKNTQPRARAPMGHLLAAEPNQILTNDSTFVEPVQDGWEPVMVMMSFQNSPRLCQLETRRFLLWLRYW